MSSDVLNIGGIFTVTPGTETISLPPIAIPSPVGEIRPVALTTGDNTIAVPAGVTMALVTIPPTTTVTLKLGPGATPAMTLAVNTTVSLWAAFPITDASFVINASAAAVVVVTFL